MHHGVLMMPVGRPLWTRLVDPKSGQDKKPVLRGHRGNRCNGRERRLTAILDRHFDFTIETELNRASIGGQIDAHVVAKDLHVERWT